MIALLRVPYCFSFHTGLSSFTISKSEGTSSFIAERGEWLVVMFFVYWFLEFRFVLMIFIDFFLSLISYFCYAISFVEFNSIADLFRRGLSSLSFQGFIFLLSDFFNELPMFFDLFILLLKAIPLHFRVDLFSVIFHLILWYTVQI